MQTPSGSTCNGGTYPLKPGVVVSCMDLSRNRFCLSGLAWGHRGGPCTRMSLHRSTVILPFGVWLGRGVAHVFRAQLASQISVLSSEKICKNLETHVQSKNRFQRQGPADLQPFKHDEEYLQCRIRYHIRYHILYIIYDIVSNTVYDIVYDIVYIRYCIRYQYCIINNHELSP